MTKYKSEEIKNRLSNIGEAIGVIALEYIEELEKEKCELLGIIQKKDELIKNLICCANCKHFKEYNDYPDIYYACELKECDNLDKWELAE